MKRLLTHIISSSLAIMIFTSNVMAFDTGLNSDLLLLVNKDNAVDMNYVPSNLVSLSNIMPVNKSGMTIRGAMAWSLEQMYDDMKELGLRLNGISGYRSYSYQSGLYSSQVNKMRAMGYTNYYQRAAMVVAKQGTSEHQLGLAVDVSDNFSLTQAFAQTASGRWLKENCHKYGFIIRYDNDKENLTNVIYEPWHLRFVGKPHSEYMYANNLCLEEYLGILKAIGHLSIPYQQGEYNVFYTTDTTQEFINVIDISRDNMGGYIITTNTRFDAE